MSNYPFLFLFFTNFMNKFYFFKFIELFMYLNYNIAEIQQLFNECENGIFTYKRVYGIIVGKYKD